MSDDEDSLQAALENIIMKDNQPEDLVLTDEGRKESSEPASKKSKTSNSSGDSSYKTSDDDDDDDDDSDEEMEEEDETDGEERELDLPADRNRIVKGKAVEPYHSRRKIERNMAAQGLYENRDITELTSIVATSPRLKAILETHLSKWKPSLPLLVRFYYLQIEKVMVHCYSLVGSPLVLVLYS
jgi:TATA-binding protein-associated factor Taf7